MFMKLNFTLYIEGMLAIICAFHTYMLTAHHLSVEMSQRFFPASIYIVITVGFTLKSKEFFYLFSVSHDIAGHFSEILIRYPQLLLFRYNMQVTSFNKVKNKLFLRYFFL